MSVSSSPIPTPVVVHVIEDDESSRIASSRLLKNAGYEVRFTRRAPDSSRRPAHRRWLPATIFVYQARVVLTCRNA